MNINTGWWTSCIEDNIIIYNTDAVTVEGYFKVNGVGDYISNRNSAGRIAVLGNDSKIRFLTSGLIQTAKDTLTDSFDGSYGVVSCASNFYSIINNNGDFTIRQYTDTGTYTTQTWTITGNYERNHGAVLTDSIFYWSNSNVIKAWDLSGNVALPNLVTISSDYLCHYILATTDGRIAVSWVNNDPALLNQLVVYNTDGTIWASGSFYNTRLLTLSNTVDWASGQMWCARYDVGDVGFLLKLDYSSGGLINTTQIITTPAISTYPPHAEFGFYPLAAGSGQLGGMYKLIKDRTHDEIWVGETSYVSIKRPDPFATTALFGDEP